MITFSCNKYGNIGREALNDINQVDNINFQTEKKLEKLKLFFDGDSLGSFFR